jgi:hypothetical protein
VVQALAVLADRATDKTDLVPVQTQVAVAVGEQVIILVAQQHKTAVQAVLA